MSFGDLEKKIKELTSSEYKLDPKPRARIKEIQRQYADGTSTTPAGTLEEEILRLKKQVSALHAEMNKGWLEIDNLKKNLASSEQQYRYTKQYLLDSDNALIKLRDDYVQLQRDTIKYKEHYTRFSNRLTLIEEDESITTTTKIMRVPVVINRK